MKTLAKTIIPALAALGIAGTAVTPAFAQEALHTKVQVRYDDLNLGTVEGQKQLDRRVEKAVRTACRTTSASSGTRLMTQDALACLARARADAKKQVAAVIRNEQRGG